MPRAKVTLLTFLALLLSAAVAFVILWHQGTVQRYLDHWLKRQVIQGYIDRLQPKLPFRIESVDFDLSWEDVRNVRVPNLKIVLTRDAWRVQMQGLLTLRRKSESKLISFNYVPTVFLDYEKKSAATLFLNISADVQQDLSSWKEFSVEGQASQVTLVPWGVSMGEFEALVNWTGQQLTTTWKADTFTYGDELSITGPWLRSAIELRLEPFSLGSAARVELGATNLEAMRGEVYLDLPLKSLPLLAEFQLRHPSTSPRIEKLSVKIPQAEISGDLLYSSMESQSPSSAKLNWRVRRLPIPTLISTLGTLEWVAPFKNLQIKKGTLDGNGWLRFPLSPEAQVTGGIQAGGELHVRKLAVREPKGAWAVRDLNLLGRFSTLNGQLSGSADIAQVFFKHFKGKLPTTPFVIHRDAKVSLPKGIPLEIDGLPMTLGPIETDLRSGSPRYFGSFALELASLKPVAQGFCYSGRIPPAKVSIQFPRMELGRDFVNPDGEVRITLFGGQVEIDKLGAFNLGSAVPEFDFNARWDGIRLDELGRWLRFGQMDGTLKGHARDVVFQSWLPTLFDFRFELNPYRRNRIVFTPRAMKNFVKLFADDALENLPGMVDWFYFGLPSRLLGGYDIDYAGLSVISKEGLITIRTLDPPQPKSLQGSNEHYILRGNRFKMPLRSTRYPVVADAAAMGNYMRQLALRFSSITGAPDDSIEEEKPDEKLDPCLVPDL